MSEPIVDFTKEVGRCSYHALESNQELENFMYNGISYAEGVETYRLKLQNLFGDFKGAVNSVALQSGYDRVLKSILEDLEKINGQYWDIPTQDVIEGYEKEMATGKYPNHKTTIREMKFLQEMVGAQKSYVQQAIDYIRGLLSEESPITINEVVEKKVDIEEKGEKHDKDNNENIIGGIRGLKQYLACSLDKAQRLSNSGVLKRAGIQYGDKCKWYFKKDKLDEYIRNNPETLFPPRRKKTSRKG